MSEKEGVKVEKLDSLQMQGNRLLARFDADQNDIPVSMVYLQPLTAQSHIALLNESSEVLLTFPSVEALPTESQPVAEMALAARYRVPRITKVNRTEIRSWTRYWDVETDLGPRRFALIELSKNVLWLSDTHLILRDSMGNRFEIPDLSALDKASQQFAEAVL